MMKQMLLLYILVFCILGIFKYSKLVLIIKNASYGNKEIMLFAKLFLDRPELIVLTLQLFTLSRILLLGTINVEQDLLLFIFLFIGQIFFYYRGHLFLNYIVCVQQNMIIALVKLVAHAIATIGSVMQVKYLETCNQQG